MNSACHRICLTPTRNEIWIIKSFLAAAKCWASKIIIVDQRSTDGTRAELQTTTGVEVLFNESETYDEAYRQRLLIDHARQFSGKRILLALDADEALSANAIASDEWKKIASAAPGTILRARWVNILSGFERAWMPRNPIPIGFVDDGSQHVGERIHSRRVPWPEGAPVLDLHEIVVLHFQFVATERVTSKQRWYQAWEHLNHPDKGALQIFRQYHHMNGSWHKDEIVPVKAEWLEGYDRAGITFRSLSKESVTWWDRDLVELLVKHGPQQFRRAAIWDKDWDSFARELGFTSVKLSDPRSIGEKLVHRVLNATQAHRTNWIVRALERCLRSMGW